MEFSEVIRRRRSVRSFLKEPVAAGVIDKAIDDALQAPNSSNMQTWRIFWVKSAEAKAKLVHAALAQGAAASASELVVFVADPSKWKHTQQFILNSFGASAPTPIKKYYGTLMPLLYGYRWLALGKWLAFNIVGLFQPMIRAPWSSQQVQEICVKSTALAAENFMLSITDQGYDSCPMEGFDSSRVKRLLKLPCRAAVVMIVGVGRRDPAVDLFVRYQLPRDTVVTTV